MLSVPKQKYKKANFIKLNGIEGNVKKFDKKLHDKFDSHARFIIKNIFKDNVTDNPNIYGEDMIFNVDKFPYKFLELQVLSRWDSNVFPYICPFVYARKMKFSNDTLFITFNKLCTEFIIFDRKSIDNIASRLKKYDRELVHYVAWGKCMKSTTNNLSLDYIRIYAGEDID